jgi:hypothetical protein
MTGCRSNPADGEVAFTRKFSGPIGVADEAKNAVVKSQEEWRALWAAGGPGRVAPPVELDWSKSMLIAVALGSRPSGGFSVVIEKVTREGSRLFVTARETRPAPDSMQTTMVTAPFDCVELPRFEGRVVFTVE